MAQRKSTAEKEGFVVLSDQELKQGVENRVRQLEGELAGHRVLLDEAKADPHDDSSVETHTKSVESLEARLGVARKRLADLKANIKDADDSEEQPPA